MQIESRADAEAAARRMLAIEDGAEVASEDVPAIDGFYVCEPIRGGRQLLLGRDGSALFGSSRWGLEQLVAKYLAGERTPRERFAS